MNIDAKLSEQYKYARILMIDDEPANLKLLDRMLSHEGYTNLVVPEIL